MLYFGKFSTKHPEQIKERYYAAGEEGTDWYGGIQPGDFVFPIYGGKVDWLWRVLRYTKRHNKVNQEEDGVVEFEQIKSFSPIRLSDEFVRYRYFEMDLNLLNKSAKSVKNCGFLPIAISSNCPEPQEIEFTGNLRNIYISLEKIDLNPTVQDIRVTINNLNEKRIIGVHIWDGNQFKVYEPLWNLYLEKNSKPERYTLDQLIKYARQDQASQKEKYLESVIKDLDESGVFWVSSPIALYDNILVGRKKTPLAKTAKEKQVNFEPEVIDESDTEDLSEYERYARLLTFNPNLILYGPPGTGKTYTAMRIVECFEKLRNGGTFVPFQSVVAQERAEFVTFHQAYSYEEFIEGIRPVLDNESQDEAGNDLKYKIEDGVLKRMANTASIELMKGKSQQGTESIVESSVVWKVSLGSRYKEEEVYKRCRENSEIAIGWLEDQSLKDKSYDDIYVALEKERRKSQDWEGNPPKPTNDASSIDAMVNGINKGDVVLIYDGPTTIRDIAVVEGDYFYDKDDVIGYPHRRKVTWLKHFDEPADIFTMNGQTKLTLKTIYPLGRLNMADIRQLLIDDNEEQQHSLEDGVAPFYLIIDEINRGNIAKIFGELITLIEKDKRDKIPCTLPYSKKPFTLPTNLYIIGTMNTADRSIAILDTALRRRFAFVELEPDLRVFDNPSLIASAKVNDRIDLAQLLDTLNSSINKQLDRDHRIGHSYFMEVVTLSDLYNIWYYKIIPLLLDYFYNDITTLKGIIGTEFFTDAGSVNYLDTVAARTGVSEFENALLKILSRGQR